MFKTTLKKKSSINIIPMIDVIFFLLVFFMLFTTFQTSPSGIELELPTAVTVTEQEVENMIIDINSQGEVFYLGEKITLGNLQEIAREKYLENRDLVVILNGDKQAKYMSIVSVMDNLRQVGIYKLYLAADKKE